MKALWRMGFWGAVGIAGLTAAGLGPVAGARPAAAAVVVEASEQQPQSSDAMITAVIQAKLESIKLLRQAQVTIATTNGVVTLVGTVPSDFARVQALDAVRGTPGVTRVDDHLRLDVSSPEAPTRN